MFKINSKINFVRILSGLIIILGIILLIMAITAKVASQNKPAESVSSPSLSVISNSSVSADAIKNNNISYLIDSGNGQKIYDGVFILEKSPLSNLNVFTVLKELAEKNKFDISYNYDFPKLGVLIDSIGGIKGDSEKYWQYYINGALGQVAADKQELKAGDKVEWRFEKVPEL